jgi:hypothetical protein
MILAMANNSIDWKWVFWGIIILLVVQFGVRIAFTLFGILTLGIGFLLYIFVKPISYFLGGLVTGLISPGITIREPAISAVIVTAVGIVFDVTRSVPGRILWLILSSVVAFILAVAGAKIGEKLQR